MLLKNINSVGIKGKNYIYYFVGFFNATKCMLRSEDNFYEWFSPFSIWVLGMQQRLLGFDGKYIYPINHHDSPKQTILITRQPQTFNFSKKQLKKDLNFREPFPDRCIRLLLMVQLSCTLILSGANCLICSVGFYSQRTISQ